MQTLSVSGKKEYCHPSQIRKVVFYLLLTLPESAFLFSYDVHNAEQTMESNRLNLFPNCALFFIPTG